MKKFVTLYTVKQNCIKHVKVNIFKLQKEVFPRYFLNKKVNLPIVASNIVSNWKCDRENI